MKSFAMSVLSISILAASSAHAGSTCMGETKSGKFVAVNVPTAGTMGSVRQGSVKIYDKSVDTVTEYQIPKQDITGFFEGCRKNNPADEMDCQEAVVGISAYLEAGASGSVFVNYVGPSYSGTLEDELKNPSRKKLPNNRMRVWKGEQTSGPDSYFEFKDVVCMVDFDV